MQGIISKEKSLYSSKHFDDLVSPIYNGLYRYIYSFIRNKDLADDVFQNTLIKAYCSLSSLNDELKFKTWIYTIGKHQAIDVLRANRKEVLFDGEYANVVFSEEVDFPEEVVIDREMKRVLYRAVNELDFEDREFIILRYFNELSLKEIAEVMNIKYATARTRHRNIKKKLYNILKMKEYSR